MCTVFTYKNNDSYFARNMDIEYHFNEEVVITPRNYNLTFKKHDSLKTHYAIIGMATVINNYPLYADAFNEYGLAMAGLNFPGNACYRNCEEHVDNIAPYELIPWILGKCQSVQEARELLAHTCIVEHNFSEQLPAAPLHWIISDGENTITVEATKAGLEIFDNPVGVLTNNPPFPYHMMNLNNYMNLTSQPPVNRFAPDCDLKKYGSGMGGIGLPGDCSPASRFVRASFLKLNAVSGPSEKESVNQFFHMLGDGCLRIVKMGNQILVADGFHTFVALHDVAKELQPYRMSQRIGDPGDHFDVLLFNSVVIFSYSHFVSSPLRKRIALK